MHTPRHDPSLDIAISMDILSNPGPEKYMRSVYSCNTTTTLDGHCILRSYRHLTTCRYQHSILVSYYMQQNNYRINADYKQQIETIVSHRSENGYHGKSFSSFGYVNNAAWNQQQSEFLSQEAMKLLQLCVLNIRSTKPHWSNISL